MAEAESVLLTVRAKYKPSMKEAGLEGVLMLTPRFAKWTPNNPGAATPLSIDFKTIKKHFNTKEESKKALMKLMTDVDPKKPGFMFEFNSFDDRNKANPIVGSIIARHQPPVGPSSSGAAASAGPTAPSQTSKPSGAGRASSQLENVSQAEIEQRMAVLAKDADLRKLHEQLVGTGILTDAEFWSTRKGLLEKEAAKQSDQKTGLSSQMLTALKPVVDGRTNKVSFNLTPQIIHQIFQERPLVLQRYMENVPDKLSEAEFWTRYCKAEYLHSQRRAGAQAAVADMDEEAEAMFRDDDAGPSREEQTKIRGVDPTLNMAADQADDYYQSTSGYGLLRDGGKEAGPSRESAKKRKIAHDINRHAAVVLDGRPAGEDIKDPAAAAAAVNAARAAAQLAGSRAENGDPAREQRWHEKLQEATDMPDLHPQPQAPAVPLRIEDPRRYFDVSTGGPASTSAGGPQTDGALWAAMREQAGAVRTEGLGGVLPPAKAFQVLSEVQQQIQVSVASAGKKAGQDLLKQLPASVKDDVFQSAATAHEMLRHFWGAYPITSATLLNKANRLKDAMAGLYERMQRTKEGIPSEYREPVSQLFKPVFQMLDAAFAHYESEEELRKARQQRAAANRPAGVNGTAQAAAG
ncbi:transcription initiation factor TFIIH subunit 1 [Klebsormidium nitens]|uniref:Transcription initiation factor TFIIH subunit 1 n=1 Tax=Klebsormidium nitens TaxID=105231 RepID=A0A1Y1I5A0_KLENI|nr:transcription initiation factor TFIIH subunit 1 [Klebsormidium nitens]|eukprot:GAQ84341.1 transcription initiation factor TFIIH subunit 1 [Klebsormidium nitens]